MGKPVLLRQIIEGLDRQGAEFQTYLDRETGEVVIVSDDDRRYVKGEADPEDAPAWQRPSIELAELVESDDRERFIALPSSFEIHEWQILRDFAEQAGRHAEVLLDAVHRKGAFRMFQDAVRRLDIEDEWYAYRQARFREIAIEWCKAKGVEYVEEERKLRGGGGR